MSNIIWILLLIGILVYLALLFFSSSLLLAAGYMAVLLLLALIFLVYRSFCFSCRAEVPIAVTDEGKKASMQLDVQNRSPFVCGKAAFCVIVRNTFQKGRYRTWLKASDILPGENRIMYTLQVPEAGCYEIQVKCVRLYDLTGLFWIRKRVNRSVRVQVLPDIYPTGIRLTEPVLSFFGDAEVYDEERAGQDTDEVFQIRPFRRGDKLQSIHWKLSAKMDDLMVKEYSLPKACPVVLFLDYAQGGDSQSFLHLAAGLSFSLMDAGCPHYVSWFDDKTKDITRVRVEDEESYYLFISSYLLEQGKGPEIPLVELYREKYRGEEYVHSLLLTGKPELFKNDEALLSGDQKASGQSIKELEIVV